METALQGAGAGLQAEHHTASHAVTQTHRAAPVSSSGTCKPHHGWVWCRTWGRRGGLPHEGAPTWRRQEQEWPLCPRTSLLLRLGEHAMRSISSDSQILKRSEQMHQAPCLPNPNAVLEARQLWRLANWAHKSWNMAGHSLRKRPGCHGQCQGNGVNLPRHPSFAAGTASVQHKSKKCWTEFSGGLFGC